MKKTNISVRILGENGEDIYSVFSEKKERICSFANSSTLHVTRVCGTQIRVIHHRTSHASAERRSG